MTTTNPESFTVDAASNITARTGPAKTFTIDGSNRPTSDGTNALTWSAADRLTGRGADTFGFDPLDRLTSSTVAGTARTYTYSGDGLLQSRTTAGSTVNLVWDPATSPSRLLVSGSDKIVYGLGPLYSVNGTTVTTYARDGQKSIRAELNGTSVTSSWRYRAYGETAQYSGAAAPSILGYAGQVLDASGLYYMRARWYDAANARFASRDPQRGDSSEPSTLNAFAYAVARPTMLRDPAGMCPFVWAVACVGPTIVDRPWLATPSSRGLFDSPPGRSLWDKVEGAEAGDNAEGKGANEGDEAEPQPEHTWIPKGKQGEIATHEVKRKNRLPKGVDLAWDEWEGDVCAHAKGAQGEVSGECNPIASWEELVREFPGRRGLR